jgi:hypothetical protein
MRQCGKAYVKHIAGAQPADHHSHRLVSIAVLARLRAVIFFTVNNRLFGCRRKIQFLGQAPEFSPYFFNLLN